MNLSTKPFVYIYMDGFRGKGGADGPLDIFKLPSNLQRCHSRVIHSGKVERTFPDFEF